jgi:hypothetical protein
MASQSQQDVLQSPQYIIFLEAQAFICRNQRSRDSFLLLIRFEYQRDTILLSIAAMFES